MSDAAWFLLCAGGVIAIATMTLAWLVARRLGNAGIVDVAWPFGFVLIAAFYYAYGEGDPLRKALICGMVAAWGLRLGVHLGMRVARHHPGEDGRYAALRAQYPRNTWLMFFGYFQLQALLLAVLSVPFALAVSNSRAALSGWEWAGAGLWLAALLGEALADFQLHAFVSRGGGDGRVCRSGLWRFSRHPNYFFEWLVWLGYFVFALGSPDGWLSACCPVLVWILLFTSIPAAEAQALKSCGADYREYRRATSAFVPWFPKK